MGRLLRNATCLIRRRAAVMLTPAGALLLALLAGAVSCATYEGAAPTSTSGSGGDAGAAHGSNAAGDSGSSALGGTRSSAAGSGGSLTDSGASAGGASAGANGGAVSATGGVAGNSGSAGNAAGSSARGGNAGIGGGAGTAGSAGATAGGGGAGTAGSAGATAGGGGGAGTTGSAGSAGSSGVVDQLLSKGKPATADSSQVTPAHPATDGNDGSSATRWCAADGALNHYWQVDLGATFAIGKLDITWEKSAVYKFRIEGSTDNTTWSTLNDQTTSSNASASQSYPLSGAPSARWVKLTVTGLANTSTWASFFELSVYGH